jgi:hypothetical protein
MIIVPVYLVTLAVGYWVLTISQSQQRPLDILGRVVGVIILVVSLLGSICTMTCGHRGGSCGMAWCGAPRPSGCGMMAKGGCPMEHAMEAEKAPEEKK